MAEKVAVQPGEVGVVPLADYLIKVLLRQRLANTMKDCVIIERMEVIASDNRAVLKRGKMFFPRHAIDYENIL